MVDTYGGSIIDTYDPNKWRVLTSYAIANIIYVCTRTVVCNYNNIVVVYVCACVCVYVSILLHVKFLLGKRVRKTQQRGYDTFDVIKYLLLRFTYRQRRVVRVDEYLVFPFFENGK